MKFTLVSPRLFVQKGDFFGSGVPYWPLEMAILASVLREFGHEVGVIDCFGVAPWHLEEHPGHYWQGAPILDFLGSSGLLGADCFGVYALSYMSHQEVQSILRWLRKQYPEKRLAVFENSQAVTGYDLEPVASDFFIAGADLVVCGEIYGNIDQVLNAWLGYGTTFPENTLVANQVGVQRVQRHYKKKLSAPIPAWDLFPLQNYWSLPYSHGPKTSSYFPLLTSRGCPYGCDFCVCPTTNQRHWRPRDAEEVVHEMLTLRDRFGVRDFQIEDINPTVSGRRWEEICRLLIEAQAGIRFYFVSGTKAETIALNQIPLFAQAGCRFISFSPESGDPELMKKIGKSFDYDHGLELVKKCVEEGVSTQACFLIGHPDERTETFKQTRNYVKNLSLAGLDELAVFVVAPVIGSRIFHQKTIVSETLATVLAFSAKGRPDYSHLRKKQKLLIKTFLGGRLKNPRSLLKQAWRVISHQPATKLENLPWRILAILSMLIWNVCLGAYRSLFVWKK